MTIAVSKKTKTRLLALVNEIEVVAEDENLKPVARYIRLNSIARRLREEFVYVDS